MQNTAVSNSALLTVAPKQCQVSRIRKWRSRTFLDGTAPFAVVRPHPATRYRLPRAMKQELIERFCNENSTEQITPRVMMVVAHPDDESIGAGARLCHLGDAWVVHTTDGAPRDVMVAHRHGYSSPEEYAEARARELREAIALIGLPQERMLSLNITDGGASLQLVELCLRIADLIDRIQPDVLLTHPYEGGHTDHDATAFAVHLACGLLRRDGVRPPAVLEIASYHARDGQKVVQEFLPHERADRDRRLILLSEEERELKQQLYDCFESQQTVLSTFSTCFEQFRPAPRYLFTAPPHDGLLNYERYGDPRRGEQWRKLAEQALRELRVRK